MVSVCAPLLPSLSCPLVLLIVALPPPATTMLCAPGVPMPQKCVPLFTVIPLARIRLFWKVVEPPSAKLRLLPRITLSSVPPMALNAVPSLLTRVALRMVPLLSVPRPPVPNNPALPMSRVVPCAS